ncbi:MAG: ANTAR domain-containing protein [Lachnospiraceae bacterium]|nr:ANTAR domain-containing protein [Lachnospiraceae bacterium]
MADIIVAFPRIEDAKNLRKLLMRNGYEIHAVCDSGAQIMDAVNRSDGGIVISGYRFSDMYYREIYDYLPKGFQLLLLASPAKLSENDISDMLTLPMPFKMQDLFHTIDMMMVEYRRYQKRQKRKPKARSETEEKTILKCKELLMERNGMTEDEAHHYIQKLSMDGGNSFSETAEMILTLNCK